MFFVLLRGLLAGRFCYFQNTGTRRGESATAATTAKLRRVAKENRWAHLRGGARYTGKL